MSYTTSETESQNQEPSIVLNLRKEVTKYSVGDVLFVERKVGNSEEIGYHHAGVVMEVRDNGEYVVAHFDPAFDHQEIQFNIEYFKQLLTGVYAKPKLLEGDDVDKVFPPKDTRVSLKGPEDESEVKKVKARIEASLHNSRLYRLHLNNCQHYATEMSTGQPGYSTDATNLFSSFVDGIHHGLDSGQFLVDNLLIPTINYKPFNDDSLLKRVGNAGFRTISTILVLLIIALSILGITGFSTISSYFTRTRDQNSKSKRKKRDDDKCNMQ